MPSLTTPPSASSRGPAPPVPSVVPASPATPSAAVDSTAALEAVLEDAEPGPTATVAIAHPVGAWDAQSFHSGRRSSTKAVALDAVDIDAEFELAFGDGDTAAPTPAAAVADVPLALPLPSDDAFQFDASFGPTDATDGTAITAASAFSLPPPSTAGTRRGRPPKTVEFKDDFAEFDLAFESAPAAPAATSSSSSGFDDVLAAFGPPAAAADGGAAAASPNAVDLDAAFGGGGGGGSTGGALGFDSVDFDGAFADFGGAAAVPAVDAVGKTEVGKTEAAAAADDGVMDEVKELMSMGFTKDDSVKALEKNSFDVRTAANSLISTQKKN
ncbi:hypothetical protein HK405_009883 [Cladochytrium tenue]|nr:hypothetical protein HK405_009883 [Cladochytrium tenue]